MSEAKFVLKSKGTEEKKKVSLFILLLLLLILFYFALQGEEFGWA